MGDKTNIGWTDHTLNPWIGCTAVSSACDHCYAERMAKQYGWDFAGRRRTSVANWRKPLAWNRSAEADGVRRRAFCASLADVFDNQVPAEWRSDLFDLIRACPALDWQLLTKRPQNIAKMLPPDWDNGWPNVWLGTTVENQAEADRRIPHLLAVPAAVRFLSCEPLLGPVDLNRIHEHAQFEGGGDWHSWESCLTGRRFDIWSDGDIGGFPRIDWVIAGGESGPGARPSNPQWFRNLRDQCAAAGVPFFFKQWGEWVSVSEVEGPGTIHEFEDFRCVRRVGTKKAGNLLDGCRHEAFPISPAATL